MLATVADKKGEYLERTIYSTFLAVNSWLDFRSREISLILAGIYGISGILYSIFTGRPIEIY